MPTPCDRNPYPLPYPYPYPYPYPVTPCAWNKGNPLPRLPLPLKLIYFVLYSFTLCPLFKCPMQHLKDALTAAALTFLAWLTAVAFLSL